MKTGASDLFQMLLASAAFVIATGFLGSCGKRGDVPVSHIPVRVKVVTATYGEYPDKVRATGTLIPVEKTAVTSKVEGRIRRLTKRLGERVSTGEVLAELETQSVELDVRKAQVEVRQAAAAVKLAEARHGEAKRRVENNLVAASRAEDGVSRREISLGNRRRILSNQALLLVQGGVPRDRVETLDSEIRQEELDLTSARKELVMLKRGLRDEDFIEAGLPIPLDHGDRLAGLKEMGTRIEAAEVEQAQGALAASELRLEAARLYLSECTIRSPRPGVVAQRTLDPGEEATRQTPLYVILETDWVHASVNLGEGELARVLVGQKASLFTSHGADTNESTNLAIPAYVDLLSPMLDPSSRSGEARLRVKSRAELRPGMAVRVVIDTGRTVRSVRVPGDAVDFQDREGDPGRKPSPGEVEKSPRTSTGGAGNGVSDLAHSTGLGTQDGRVWVVVAGVAHRRVVTAIPPRQGPVDILAGLQEGDAVVVEGMDALREGQPVVE